MTEFDKKYILVADDDPATVRLIKTIVESEGFVAITAADGKEAYRVIQSGGPISGAIVDIRMPYIEGTELVKFMRSDERFSKIPVVMMTGERKPQVSSTSRSAGAIAFLPKPFTNTQLKLMLNIFRSEGVQ